MIEVKNFWVRRLRDLLASIKETSPLQSDRWEAMYLLNKISEGKP